MYSIRYSCQIIMTLKFSLHVFEKYPDVKFHDNPSSESRVVPSGQTDRWTDITKVIVAFRNFATRLNMANVITFIIRVYFKPEFEFLFYIYQGCPTRRTSGAAY